MPRTKVFVVLVCGSRNWRDHTAIGAAIQEMLANEPYLLVITGGAPGADTMAHDYARSYGAHTAVIRALWDKGKQAGTVRNRVMLDLAPDYVIAFRSTGISNGTDDCIGEAALRRIPITVVHENGHVQKIAALPKQGELLDG